MNTDKLEVYLGLDYPVEIRAIPAELGGGYSAAIPFLGRGAFHADGDTPAEALENLQEVKRVVFEDLLEQGKEIPPPPPRPEDEEYSGRILLRMPKWLHAHVAARAAENGCSINQYMIAALATEVGGEECAAKLSAKISASFAEVLRQAQRYVLPWRALETTWTYGELTMPPISQPVLLSHGPGKAGMDEAARLVVDERQAVAA